MSFAAATTASGVTRASTDGRNDSDVGLRCTTTAIAAGRPRGNRASSRVRASTPPAEAPTTTRSRRRRSALRTARPWTSTSVVGGVLQADRLVTIDQGAESLRNIFCPLEPTATLLIVDGIRAGAVALREIAKQGDELFVGKDGRPHHPLDVSLFTHQELGESVDLADATFEDQAPPVADVVADRAHHQIATAV